MSTVEKKSRFHVGDKVRFNLNLRKISGKVIEDHGAIGVGGRHLYRISVPMGPDEPLVVELADDEIDGIDTEIKTADAMKKQAVIDYLKNGGLIAMLQSNMSGGKTQPRAWLCFDPIGNVTHTFDSEQGLVGGQTVPFWAKDGDKVFGPKRDLVAAFVQSFGLTQGEASKVISEVGTVP